MPSSDFSVLENFRIKNFDTKTHTENRMQNRVWNNCLDFITKEIWLPKSYELNPLDNHIWRNVRGQSHAPSNTEDIAELKEMLQMIAQIRVG